MAMKGLPEDLAAYRVQLRHKVCGEEPQVVLLQDDGAGLGYLQGG